MDVEEGGHTFWNPIPVSNCKFHKYIILYEGYANKINDLIHNRPNCILTSDRRYNLCLND